MEKKTGLVTHQGQLNDAKSDALNERRRRWRRKKRTSKIDLRLVHSFLKGVLGALFLAALFAPDSAGIGNWKDTSSETLFSVYLNGQPIGISENADMNRYLRAARMELAKEGEEMLLTDANISVSGKKVLWGKIDSDRSLIDRMKAALVENRMNTLHKAYTVKINGFTVNLASSKEVLSLLNTVLNKYDENDEYEVRLIQDPNRELNVLTTKVESRQSMQEKEERAADFRKMAGAELAMMETVEPTRVALTGSDEEDETEESPENQTIGEHEELGLIDLTLGERVEIVEAYLPEYAISSLEDAITAVTKEEEKDKIYEVQSGDTLSQIAETTGISIDKLVEINPTIENKDATIRAGDEIIVTSPEPELTVIRTERVYYEEDYEAEVQYIENDEWYTNRQEIVQNPSAGHRKAVAVITYRNDAEIERKLEKQEVSLAAVPKIVERGTKIPPTYIKPISGGRLSSGFGKRKAPTKGASTFHKGVDWATPVGTAVVASSGGTVTRAGWGSGYGYVVYIDHGDGRQTRYGHLSKVLVKAGQSVKQGEKIALSGNTGRSTGAHLHFEILIGGTQVNPLGYLS